MRLEANDLPVHLHDGQLPQWLLLGGLVEIYAKSDDFFELLPLLPEGPVTQVPASQRGYPTKMHSGKYCYTDTCFATRITHLKCIRYRQ
jgi:hypothetical protein